MRIAPLLACLSAAAVTSLALAADEQKWNVNAPPGEPAVVTLDVTTGTWMGVDVSPDGRTLVFDLLGDLYTLPIEGGEAKALTHSIAWEMQPRFSPDGKRLAFVSDAGGGDNVWLMNADGSEPRAVSQEDYRLLNNPVWHPGGEYLAARKHYSGTRSLGSGEIWLYHTGGGKGVALNEKPNWQKDLGEPAFSPDGRHVYFSRDSTPGRVFEYNRDSNGQIYEIFRLDTTDGRSEPFVSGPGGAVRPTPSPDGRWLAFVRRVREQSVLHLKDLGTGEERPAWGPMERDMQEAWAIHGVYPGFAWTRDSKTIVAWARGKLWRIDPFAGTAAEIPFRVRDTREVRRAVRFKVDVAPERFAVHQLRWVNVSPRGDKVVYSALGSLWVRELPAGTPRRLTRATDRFEFFPSFSRDGREVVFTTWTDDKLGTVRKIDVASGRETALVAAPGKYLEPRFSPDGRTVVYVKSVGGYLTTPWHGLDPGVYRVAADGRGAPLRVTREGEAPQFDADGKRVYVTRQSVRDEVELSTTLVSMNLDGGEEREVARSEFATEFALSPDGRWLAFAERFHAYVAPLPATGKRLEVGPQMASLPVRRLDVNAGEYLHWSGDSRSLHFTLGDELFSRPLTEAFDWVPGAATPLPRAPEKGVNIGFQQASDRPSATVAVTGGRVVTMRGDEVIEGGTVLVRGNRIEAVGPASAVAVPPGATVIDARGKTVIPGLIDAHWHGGMGEDEIIPQQSWVNYASLAFGVTTLHDPSNDSSEIFTTGEMQRAGVIVGPRVFSTGTILYGAKARFSAEIGGLDDAITHLKRMRAAGAISVKSYNQPRREQRQQILEAGRQTGMMVVPEGGSLFQHNMTQVVDGHTSVEHTIPVAVAWDDVRQLWSQTQVGYTPTLGVAFGGLDGEHYWYARTDVWRHPLLSRYVPRSILEPRAVRRETAPEEDFNVFNQARIAADLAHRGVLVNVGAHGQREGLAAHWELWTMVMGGMTPLEAIRAGTLNPAKQFGMDADLGSLEPGKLADLVIIDGDVLADIRQSDRVSHVMQNGRVFESATMNEVGATPRARRPFFFEGAAGRSAPVREHAHADGHQH
ncbi:MAG: PD40 domain-containing protein [Steroidobacteraceae bacterium]|nr:PD40 domain-containing protein [Steroidobacteraceae bacterium]MCC7200537.1 PD40 domain-containing protein [Gammaproteobacteria bacterium]